MTPAHSAAFRTLKQALATATLAVGLLSAGGAAAQQAGSPFVGFTQNRSEPINFEADRAEVFDNEKRAVLSGNVRIQQGESTLQTARLVIFYEGSAAASSGRPATTTPRQGGAERGSFDARRNEAIMEGNVTLTQCENVLRGARLHADLTANRVRLDAAPSGGRVSGILQGSGGGGGGGINNPDCAPPRPAPRAPRG